jgi:hypothetical protein
MLSRRQLLAASPTTLPLFLALTACKGPAVLSGPPPLSAQTQTLLRAVTDELNLIWIYKKTMAEYSSLGPALGPVLAEHQAHLSRLRARIIEPPGKHAPTTATARPAIEGTPLGALAQLRAAEQAAVSVQLGRLAAATPSLAQLYASIATSEATHVTTLDGRIARS